MSARIEDPHCTVVRPLTLDPGSTPGLVDQSASQRPLSSRQKGFVTAEDEVGHSEWNGAPDPEKLRTYMNLKLALAERKRHADRL
jgi:hypothetical protein